ncbi:MAG: hypothetical protein LUG21_04110 [Clostridiales bacterium]|nr:hypothetical protein [Clostridiales bacterium]
MAVSFNGFNEKVITMNSAQCKAGYPAFIDKDGSAVCAAADSEIIGICVNANEKLAGIQISGYAESIFSAGTAKYGEVHLLADGNGGVKIADDGGCAVKVIKIDNDNKTIGFIL